MPAAPKPIAVSVGEPAGIGPDCVVLLAQEIRDIPWFVIADPSVLSLRARQLGLKLECSVMNRPDDPIEMGAGRLSVFPIHTAVPVVPGCLNPSNSAYVIEGIRAATEFCLRGVARAMVTGPVHKGVINQSGIQFSGHTEWLAEYCGVKDTVMML